MCLNQTAVEIHHLYILPKFYFHQKKSRGSLKKWGYLNSNQIFVCHLHLAAGCGHLEVCKYAKNDGKEASKVPQKLSRHLEECQNVEKVPKMLKCAIFLLPICTFYSQCPRWWKRGQQSATKAPLKAFAKTSKKCPKRLNTTFLGFLSTMILLSKI